MAETENPKKLKKTVFTSIDEVAVKYQQSPDDIGEAPGHDPFLDSAGNVRLERCVKCGEAYSINFSHIYRTKRSFEDLSDQLQLRLEEDHRAGRMHRPVMPLGPLDPTRKCKREKKTQ